MVASFTSLLKKNINVPQTILQNRNGKGGHQSYFMKLYYTGTPTGERHNQENHRSIPDEHNARILNKILASWIQQHMEKITPNHIIWSQ